MGVMLRKLRDCPVVSAALILLSACEGIEPRFDPLKSKDDCADCPAGLFSGDDDQIPLYAPW